MIKITITIERISEGWLVWETTCLLSGPVGKGSTPTNAVQDFLKQIEVDKL